jgi:hypothetical protein
MVRGRLAEDGKRSSLGKAGVVVTKVVGKVPIFCLADATPRLSGRPQATVTGRNCNVGANSVTGAFKRNLALGCPPAYSWVDAHPLHVVGAPCRARLQLSP